MRTRRLATLSAALMLCLGLGARTATPETGYAKLRPTRLRVQTLKKSSANQFLATDRKGRLFLLRGDTLEVFRLRLDGDLESAGRLACRRSPENAYAAAMDPSGSTWAVAATAFDLALCDFTEQRKPSGLTGIVSSVTFSGSSPLVAVVPFGNGGMELSGRASSRVPYVFELDRNTWKPRHSAPFPEIKSRDIGFATQLKAQADSLICSGAKGAVWLASWNAYRVREVSAFETSGRELTVGSGKVEWVKFTAQERESMDKDLKKRGLDPATNQGGTVYPQSVIRAMACGHDGTIYLFVTTKDGLALDRFEPSQRSLERVLLEGVKVSDGPMSAVLANGELVFVGRSVEDSLWRIAPEALDAAPWQPVRGARFDGKP